MYSSHDHKINYRDWNCVLCSAVNMVIPAEKLGILMRTDSLLEAASRGHLKNCSFWQFVSIIFQVWKLSLKSKRVDWWSIVAVWHHMPLLASMYRVSSAATTHQLALQEVTRYKHVHWFFKLPAFPYCLNFSVQHSDLNRELVFLSAVLLCWASLHTLQPLKNKADLLLHDSDLFTRFQIQKLAIFCM